MAATTFVLTVSQETNSPVINYNVITPDGCYRSGQRTSLKECEEELEKVIAGWNARREGQQFITEIAKDEDV